MLVILRALHEECIKTCKYDPEIRLNNSQFCCFKICLFEKLGVLIFSTDPNLKPEIRREGIAYSFLLSVDGDTRWEPVILSSTSRCFDDRFGFIDGYDCNTIPMSLYEVIGCCYKQNFLKCPV